MTKKLLTTTLFSLIIVFAWAQKKKKEDIAAIKEMCGCYNITFNFAETFSPVKGYEYHDNYKSGALEYVFPIVDEKDKVVLQHLLIIADSIIIKHWRQDWVYENTDLYEYHADNTWKYKKLGNIDVKGQWTQKVFQVDDSPRYEGSGSWVHIDGRHYWESRASAPLPRREFSKRSDYNVLIRRNRHEITNAGWKHEQDNEKVNRTDSGDEIIAYEKGLNTYKKVDVDKCKVAKTWWATNQNYWADVRTIWDDVFGKKQALSINMKVDDKIMFQRLFALQDDFNNDSYESATAKEAIRKVINMHLSKTNQLAAN